MLGESLHDKEMKQDEVMKWMMSSSRDYFIFLDSSSLDEEWVTCFQLVMEKKNVSILIIQNRATCEYLNLRKLWMDQNAASRS